VKKKNVSLFFAALAVALCAGLTSCEKKSDAELIAGRWKVVYLATLDASGKEIKNETDEVAGQELVFGEDGKTLTVYSNGELISTSTYSLSGKTLTVSNSVNTVTKLTKSDLWLEENANEEGEYQIIKFEKIK
jgi:hypothetical protein